MKPSKGLFVTLLCAGFLMLGLIAVLAIHYPKETRETPQQTSEQMSGSHQATPHSVCDNLRKAKNSEEKPNTGEAVLTCKDGRYFGGFRDALMCAQELKCTEVMNAQGDKFGVL